MRDRDQLYKGKTYKWKMKGLSKAEGNQSVRIRGKSIAVRYIMERCMNLEDEWEEMKQFAVRELGSSMVAEGWSIADKATVKEPRVTRREPTTFM